MRPSSAPPLRIWASLGAQVHCSPAVPEGWVSALRHDWASRPLALASATRQIQIEVGPLPPVPAGARVQPVVLPDWTVQAQVAGAEVWLEDRLHVRVGTATQITVTEDGAGQDLWAVALTEAHRAAGWLPLHAAVVAGPAGAVAISGPSGAGKSTACLRLLAAGRPVIAEDRAWWGPAGEVTGLDRVLRAFDDSLVQFAPHLLGGPLTRDIKGKRVLPLPTTGEGGLLLALLLLGHTGDLGPAARVRLAWEATGVPLTSAAQQAAAAAVQRLLRLPLRAVTREEVLDVVAELVDEREGG
ncbi:hypothetical protein K7W42_10805 [Deinococcus sp. HMF7604]|uniref:hypothetical protein n=1 Tax=Deinococcus betulae TaxID=2873312 RepID=UPI001CCBAEC7|nr:hypothetical protein [Deinococcus betulae]MBZ9751354.1 hypothetical protein [Deinococcus betulae]